MKTKCSQLIIVWRLSDALVRIDISHVMYRCLENNDISNIIVLHYPCERYKPKSIMFIHEGN